MPVQRFTSPTPSTLARSIFLLLVVAVFSDRSGITPAQAQDVAGMHVRVLLSREIDKTIVRVPPIGAILVDTDSKRTYPLPPGAALSATKSDRGVQLSWNDNAVRGHSFALTTEPEHVFQIGANTYGGTLEFLLHPKTGHPRIVNVVPLEEYVAAVISAEYGLKDTEGTRAMAVVARTYALATQESGQLLHDDERSQVFRGLSFTTPAAQKAANDTAGYVLLHGNELVEAVYSASNGGYTASNTSVWDTPSRPYLAARKDPFDAVSPYSEWQFDVDKNVMHDLLSRRYGASIHEVRVLDTAPDGRVRTIELRAKGSGDRVVSGTAFRALLADAYGPKSARSTFFSLDDRGKSYHLEGRGFGHGVGLSQWGAHGRALEGHDHRDILAFYYPGSRLERLSSPPVSVPSGPILAALPAPDAPSQTVSDRNPITQEKKSGRILDAHSAWGRATNSPSSPVEEEDPKPTVRRVGW